MEAFNSGAKCWRERTVLKYYLLSKISLLFHWFIIYETRGSRWLIQTSIVGQLEKCQAEAYATSRRITLFRFTWNHFQGNVRNSTLKLSFFFTHSQKPRLNIRSHSLHYRENCRSSGTNRSEEKWLCTPRINCFLIGGSLYYTSILRSQDLWTIVRGNYRWLLARGAISCNAETRVTRITASSWSL